MRFGAVPFIFGRKPILTSDPHFAPCDRRSGSFHRRFTPRNRRLPPRNRRLTSLNRRFTPLNRRLTSLNRRFAPRNGHLTPFNRHFGPFNGHFTPFNGHLTPFNRHFGPLNGHFTPFNGRFDLLHRHSGPGHGNSGCIRQRALPARLAKIALPAPARTPQLTHWVNYECFAQIHPSCLLLDPQTSDATMINEFANRQNMHLTVLSLLDDATYQPIWQNQPPLAFTRKAADFRAKVSEISDILRTQQAETTGRAEQKDREEDELETIAHSTGQALADYFLDHNREGDAAEIDLSRSAWTRLRDAALLAKAKLLQQKLDAALAADAAGLADYGLTATDSLALAKETADYEAIIAAPATAISIRRAHTRALRPTFREAGDMLKSLDRLVTRFAKEPDGPRFIDAWTAARVIRDLGSRSGDGGPTPTPAG